MIETIIAIGLLFLLCALVPPPSGAQTVEQPLLVTENLAEKPALIDEIFDIAWAEGITTYDGLIAYVREKTGSGTSKTRVKRWKESRGLINE